MTACAAPAIDDRQTPSKLAIGDSAELTPTQARGKIGYDCMVERGWVDLVLHENGTFGGNVPPEQEDQYRTDVLECGEEAYAAVPDSPLTVATGKQRYGYEVEAAECLRALGYSISEPPSEAAWVDAFLTSAQGLWLPYAEVYAQAAVGAEDDIALKQQCPDPAERIYE